MNAGKGELLTKSQLCRTLGINMGTLQRWIGQGCPVRSRVGGPGGRVYFNTADVLRWRELHLPPQFQKGPRARPPGEVLSLAEERLRFERVKREHAELKLARERGEWVERAEVQRVWSQILGRVRQHLLMLPHRAAPRVYDVTSIPEIEDELKEAVHEILGELADTHVEYRPGEHDEADDGDAAPAAEAEGERMGGPLPLAQPRDKRRARKMAD
jgi:phage terminase Nu1 subunit (DNA packaging protein)